MKIAVYAIALNEEAFAERFMASCRDADLVLAADTGSTDRTVARLAALGADVRRIEIRPWRFDAARNAALALLPEDVDACVSLDLDQTLAPGWRPLVEQAWRGGATQLYYTHVYAQAGQSGEVVFQDNRIHARRGFTWMYPCHECVMPLPGRERRGAAQPALRVIHAPDPAKSRAGYLPLLELAVAERPDDPRCAHYLGREYFYVRRYDDAVRALERHLALTTDPASVERNASLRLLAHAREALGDAAGALAGFRKAAEENPRLPGAWLSLAWAAHRRQAWADALFAAERAIALRSFVQIYGDDTSPGVVAEDLACLAAWSLGHPRTALDYARDALARAPDNARIRANLARIETALRREGPQAFGVSLTPLAEPAAAAPPRRGAARKRRARG